MVQLFSLQKYLTHYKKLRTFLLNISLQSSTKRQTVAKARLEDNRVL